MSPKISAAMSDDGHCANITIYSPKRLLYHSSRAKYELKKYIVFAELEDGQEVQLTTAEGSFSEDTVFLVVPLLPQIGTRRGVVKVGAKYGDGLVVYSKPHVIEDWPLYSRFLFWLLKEHIEEVGTSQMSMIQGGFQEV